MEPNMTSSLLSILALHSMMCKGLSAQGWAFPAAFFLFICVLCFALYKCLQWFVSNLCRGRPSWELLLHSDSFMHWQKIKYTHLLNTMYTLSLYIVFKCPYWHSNHRIGMVIFILFFFLDLPQQYSNWIKIALFSFVPDYIVSNIAGTLWFRT